MLVQQHHDAVSVGVAIKLSRNNVAELPEDGHQPLVVDFPDSGGVSIKGQESHWNVGNDVNLNNRLRDRD